MKSQKLTIFIFIAILLIAVITIYRFKTNTSSEVGTTNTDELESDWKLYKTEKYQIQYPKTASETFRRNIYSEHVIEIYPNKYSSIKMYISFPKDENCGRYGPGVASKKASKIIHIDNSTKNISGWIEDPQNYLKWSEQNSEYPIKSDEESLNKYSETFSICDQNYSIVYDIKISGKENINSEEITKNNRTIEKILQSFSTYISK